MASPHGCPPWLFLAFLFVLAAASSSACSKGALTKSSPDGSVDGFRTSDVSPQPKDAFPDATHDVGTTDRADTQAVDTGPWEAKAPVDAGTESPYDARDSAAADASDFPDVPAFVDAPPEGQLDTRVLFDAENDGGREIGGGPDAGLEGESEAGARYDGSNERSQIDSVSAAVLAVSVSTVDVGDVDLGDSTSGTVVVTNHGTASSGSLTVTSGPFLTVSGCIGVLLPQASCTLVVTATPNLEGEFTSSISISATPGTDAPLHVVVLGTAYKPGEFGVYPNALDFGTVSVGAAPSTRVLLVVPQHPLPGFAVRAIGPDVKVEKISDCSEGTPAPHTVCAIEISFVAAAAGSRSDSIVISTSAKTLTIPIVATAVPLAKLSINPTTATFVSAPMHLSPATTFVVTNQGEVATGPLEVKFDTSSSFILTADTCDWSSLAPLSTCSISVKFLPSSSADSSTTTLGVWDGAAGVVLASASLVGTVTGH